MMECMILRIEIELFGCWLAMICVHVTLNTRLQLGGQRIFVSKRHEIVFFATLAHKLAFQDFKPINRVHRASGL